MKRFLIFMVVLSVLLTTSSLNYLSSSNHSSNNFIREIVIHGRIELLNNTIKEEELIRADDNSLMLIRNTIFAKYGFIFKSKDLSNHFSQFNWYIPKRCNINDFLTPLDRQNLDLILRYEHNFDCLSNILSKAELQIVGFWHALPYVPSGYSDRYAFYNNREYVFIYLMNDVFTRISGKWFILNSKIYLQERRIDKKSINSNENCYLISKIEPAGENPAYDKKIKIGQNYFWKFSDDPDFIKKTF